MKRSLGVADNVNDSIFPDILTKEKKRREIVWLGPEMIGGKREKTS